MKKYWFLYLIYAEIVLLAGIRLGAFGGRAAFTRMDLASLTNSVAIWSAAPGQVAPLPSGILLFDTETNRTTVHEGEPQANFVFNFQNASEKPLAINEVRTSCGCTVAKVQQLPWVLKPHEKGQIAVTMHVLGYVDENTKEVTVRTDRGYKLLKVVAKILPAEKAH